jgi:hypothetical protein
VAYIRGELIDLFRDHRCAKCGSFIFQGQRAVVLSEDAKYISQAEVAHYEPECEYTRMMLPYPLDKEGTPASE